jgi:mono/diheme cytochrome c family protein
MKRLMLCALCLLMLGGIFMLGFTAQNLEAGDGEAILQSRCTVCHSTGRIERAGFDLDGWKITVDRMMSKGNFGPKLSDAELQSLLDHLVSK